MHWRVLFHEEFDVEFQKLNEELQDELLLTRSCCRSSARSLADRASIPLRDLSTRT